MPLKRKNDETDRPKRSGTLEDLFFFGKVLSTGLLIAGYVFLGVWLAGWLARERYPKPLVLLAPPVVALFGLWQGWLFLRQSWEKNKSEKK